MISIDNSFDRQDFDAQPESRLPDLDPSTPEWETLIKLARQIELENIEEKRKSQRFAEELTELRVALSHAEDELKRLRGLLGQS